MLIRFACYLCSFAEAKAVVVGPTDIYVKMGSEVILTVIIMVFTFTSHIHIVAFIPFIFNTLQCVVSQGPHELGTIYWYRGKYKCIFQFMLNSKHPKKIHWNCMYFVFGLSIRFDDIGCTSWFSIERHRIFPSNNCRHKMDRCTTFKVINAAGCCCSITLKLFTISAFGLLSPNPPPATASPTCCSQFDLSVFNIFISRLFRYLSFHTVIIVDVMVLLLDFFYRFLWLLLDCFCFVFIREQRKTFE